MKIAVVGLGEHARRNTLPAIAKANCLELVALQSRNFAETISLADKYGGQPYRTIEELLEFSCADAVYIATPVGTHAEIAKLCLNSEKHVLVEKVAFTDIGDAAGLCELAKKKKRILFEGYMYFYHPQFLALKEILDTGELGPLHRLSASFGFPHLSIDNIRYDPLAGGGALFDAAGYTLSASLGLIPGDSVLLSSAIGHEIGYQVDTRGCASFLKGGVFIYNEWCFGSNYRNQIEIWAERGTIVVPRAFSKPESLEAVIEINQNGKTRLVECEAGNHFVLMFNAFVDACDIMDVTFNDKLLRQATLLDGVIKNAKHFRYDG